MTRPGRARRAAAVLGVAVLALVTAGCGDEQAPGPTTPAPDRASPTSVALPDHAAGRAASWVLDLLDGADPPSLAGEEDRFANALLDEVSIAELEHVLDQLRAVGPWTATDVHGDASGLVVRIAGPAQELDMQVAVDADERIAGLLFTPAPPPRDPATSWEDLAAEVTTLRGQTSLYVADVVDGRCEPRPGMPTGSAPGGPLPIGSIVKLYVLGAVVDAVAAGDLAWDTELTLTDDVRSLPSGRLQEEPTGTVVTVQDAARDMIAISDNTATDLLVEAVGRGAVEQAVAAMGHSLPSVNVPFATTRELFMLGWGGGEERRTQWRDADAAERRAILEELPEGPPEIDEGALARIVAWPYDIDWFATGADLCAAHAALAERAESDAGAPVREILSANPGIDPGDWSYVAFKGGSAPGTMAGAWCAEGDDGAAMVVVLQSATRHPSEALAPATMVGIVEDALRLGR